MIRSRNSSSARSAMRALVSLAVVAATILCAPWAWAAEIERVSVSGSGAEGSLESGAPSFSADGRYVAFVSAAPNLVSGDSNGAYDVFVYDLQTGSVSRVSVSSTGAQADGDSRAPVISADGQCVAFLSRATNLVAGDSNGKWDVFVHTLSTGATERVGIGNGWAQPDADCTRVSINGDGSVVAFTSAAANLVAGDTNGVADVFVRDLVAGTTQRVSVASGGAQVDRRSDCVSLSADGRYVAFDSIADDLVEADSNGKWDIFVHDRQTVTTTRVSVSSSGAQACGDSICPSMSADGRFVAFESEAGDLVSGDANEVWDVFVVDLSEGGTERVSVADDGGEANDDSDAASVSGDGRYVAFASMATDLVAGDTNGMRDVYVRDRYADATQRGSISNTEIEGRDDSDSPSMAASGAYVAFESWAAELVDSDTNGCADVLIAEVAELPTVTDVSPASGPVSGGTSVVITGTLFTDVTAVTFGGAAAEYTVDSPTQITATSPAHEAGVVQVQVVAGGISTRNTSADDFTYIAPTVYQQDDPHITYLGSWGSGSSSLASGGSYTYSNQEGAGALISFEGSSITWIAKKSPLYGKALVKLDDQDPVTVDLYSSETVYQQTVWAEDGLGEGKHTLIIQCLRQKNEAATDYFINLDALKIQGTLVSLTRHEQQDENLTFSGTYSGAWSSYASGGSFRYFNAPGMAVCVEFEGRYLAWIAKKSSVYGKALVKLDDQDPVTVDLYSSSTEYQEQVYNTGLLEAGHHTLSIYWTGEKNPAASNTLVNVDAFDVVGTLVEASAAEPLPVLTRYEQNDSDLTYSGTYYGAWSSYASGGSFRYFDSPGTAVNVKFQGTSIAWIAKKSSVYGKALVKLDDQDPVPVDLYSSSTEYQQEVYSSGSVADGEHTLSIYWTGEKNPAASNTLVNVDAFDVVGTLLKAPAAEPLPVLTRYEQNESDLTYSGTYYGGWNSSASGGSFRYFNSPGAAVNVKFQGTAIAWIAKKSPVYGKALVQLDDQDPVTVDLYSSSTEYQQEVYSSGLVDGGHHTLSIYWTGEKNPSAGNTYVSIDAFDVVGTLLEAPVAEPLPVNYQQDDPHITYLGNWGTGSSPLASGGSYTYSNQEGAAALLTFQGTSIAWIAKKNPLYGKALVQLDDRDPVTVDLYSASEVYQQTVWAKDGLTEGEHTLVIKCLGEKNESASNYYINLEALKIQGALVYGDTTTFTRYEQQHSDLTYSGTYYGGWNSSASGGSYRYFNSPGAAVNVKFQGTAIAWIAKKSSVYGKALVQLDDQEPVMVDLYSSSTEYQEQVYSSGLLDDVEHTLSIYWTGGKNPSASNTYVSIDAFDVLGTLAKAPTAERIIPLVCLDPGHGGSDPGTIGVVSLVPEREMTLAVSLLAADYLRDRGLQVLLTRQTDTYLTLEERCALANTAEADLFISIHGNAFYDPGVGGTETFYQEKTAEYTEAAIALATAVQNRVLQALELNDRGARTYYVGTLGVLDGTVMPACLVELGFMSNPAEDALLTSASGQDKAAKAIADAVCDYLGWSTSVYTSD